MHTTGRGGGIEPVSGTTAALAIPASATGRGVGTSDDVVIAIATAPVGSSGGADSGGIEGVKVSSREGDPMAFVRSSGNVAALDASSSALSTSWKPAQTIGGGAGGALPSQAGSSVPTSRPTGAVGASPAVTSQLTFNGTPGVTWTYNTSSLTPGDIMQIGLQANASGLSTGRYSYSATVVDNRAGTPTTTIDTGTATIINEALDPTFAALGAGWSIGGLQKIIPASGGVILDQGGGSGKWFSGSFGSGGGTFTSPAGDFSTLVGNSNGTYTRTLTDGTVQTFNASGLETSVVNRNGLTTTFGYSGSLLTSITDPYGEVSTLAYSGGYLTSITDPAGRSATFTIANGNLTGVTYPDNSVWSYAYNASHQLTGVTEPSSPGEPVKTTSIAYDAAGRVGSITRADGTTQAFSAAQEQGWTDTGTSTNPAAPTLLAQVGSTYTDPMGNVTVSSPDWYGMGLTVQTINALGGVTTVNRDANGLPTSSIDPMNRITQAAYDGKGNVVETTNAQGGTITYGTYNSFAEPSSVTDELGRTTTYSYHPGG